MPAPPSLRRRLAPLAAGIMALAVGIAVGAGPLSDLGTGGEQLAARTAAPTLTDASALAALEAADELAETAAPELYDRALAGRTVALVLMPGADREVVRGLRSQVVAAGARVSATYGVGDEAVATGGAALVDSLGRRLAEQQPSLPVAADATAYERAGTLMGMVVASLRPEGQQPVPATITVADSLRTAGLLDSPEAPRRRAPLVMVVTGPDVAADETDRRASDAITQGLLTGLAERSVGTVVVGTTADGVDGPLSRLRDAGTTGAEGAVATVDGIDRPSGQVLATLALVRADTGTLGDWGVSGSDGVVPRPAS